MTREPSSANPAKRGLVIAALAVGVGLALAPAAFQMFSRAPGGGKMIDAFRPYMNDPTIAKYQGYMGEIDAANTESVTRLPAVLQQSHVMTPGELAARAPSLAQLNAQWRAIDRNMSGDMLVKMERMVPNFRAVDALPPFWLFPWFFVLPGLLVAGVAALALKAARRPGGARRELAALAGLGVAIVAAPAVFQMFTRAPKGARMISTFEPIMTTKRVTTVQGYFIVIGAAEGELRTQVEPSLVRHGVSPQSLAAQLPAISRFQQDWPRISNEMAPMIGVMADNVARFRGIDALPPFWLFPWFFVLPGAMIAGCALVARVGRSAAVDILERPSADSPVIRTT